MRTVTNYFIVNLSFADVLVTIICLPASLVVDITETWFFGKTLCKVVPYLQVCQLWHLSLWNVQLLFLHFLHSVFMNTKKWHGLSETVITETCYHVLMQCCRQSFCFLCFLNLKLYCSIISTIPAHALKKKIIHILVFTLSTVLKSRITLHKFNTQYTFNYTIKNFMSKWLSSSPWHKMGLWIMVMSTALGGYDSNTYSPWSGINWQNLFPTRTKQYVNFSAVLTPSTPCTSLLMVLMLLYYNSGCLRATSF